MSSAAAAAAASMTSSPTPTGRKRSTHPTYKSEEQALDQIAKEAEERLAARRRAREEARIIRMRELERQQKEAEEQMDKDFQMKTEEKKNLSKHSMTSGTSYTSNTPNSTTSTTRRGSNDSGEQETLKEPLLDGELKDILLDLEEKYKKAMMTNAQLYNEKATLVYEVDSLKDTLEEQEEVMMELQRETRDKHRELEGKKRENTLMKKDLGTLKEMVTQRDELISEHGLLVVGDEDESPNDHGSAKRNKVGTIVVVSPEAAELLEGAGDGPLDVRLKHFVEERKRLLEEVRKLEIDLAEERMLVATAERRRQMSSPVKPAENGPDLNEMIETQKKTAEQMREKNANESLVLLNNTHCKSSDSDKDSIGSGGHPKKSKDKHGHKHGKEGREHGSKNSHGKHKKEHHGDREMGRQVTEFKFKLTRAEQEVTTLEGSVLRLEGQVKRYRTAAEQAEAQEEELKTERRKLTRENRSLRDRLEELETEKSHLAKRLDKLKSTRLAVK